MAVGSCCWWGTFGPVLVWLHLKQSEGRIWRMLQSLGSNPQIQQGWEYFPQRSRPRPFRTVSVPCSYRQVWMSGLLQPQDSKLFLANWIKSLPKDSFSHRVYWDLYFRESVVPVHGCGLRLHQSGFQALCIEVYRFTILRSLPAGWRRVTQYKVNITKGRGKVNNVNVTFSILL